MPWGRKKLIWRSGRVCNTISTHRFDPNVTADDEDMPWVLCGFDEFPARVRAEVPCGCGARLAEAARALAFGVVNSFVRSSHGETSGRHVCRPEPGKSSRERQTE